MHYVTNRQRVHVMYNDLLPNFMTPDPEIAASVSSNDLLTNLPPFSGSVERLIQPSLITEGINANLRIGSQIRIPLLEPLDSAKFCVTPNQIPHQPQVDRSMPASLSEHSCTTLLLFLLKPDSRPSLSAVHSLP